MTENMVSEPITIEYQLSEREYTSIAGRFILRNFLLKRFPIALLFYVVYVAIVMAVIGFAALDATIWLLFLLGAFILPAIIVAFSFFYPVYLYRRDAKLQARYKVEFSEKGVASTGPFGESNLNWGYFKEAREIGGGYILGAGASRPQLIPRKAFSATQEAAFRKLVERKLEFKQ